MAIDTMTPRSRRAILLGALGGIAATVAATLAHATSAAAANGDKVVLGAENLASRTTKIQNLKAGETLKVVNLSGPDSTALIGDAFGAGVIGFGNQKGVYGSSTGLSTGVGVYGYAQARTGIGVDGRNPAGIGVRGTSQISVGVQGESDQLYGVKGTSKTSYGVVGTSQSSYGVYGSSDSNYAVTGLSSISAGVAGFSDTGEGVVGSSNVVGILGASGRGRGGRFSGGKAQIRLDPSTAATHPRSGATGDLFVDKSGRLWYCRMGGNPATWKQIAFV